MNSVIFVLKNYSIFESIYYLFLKLKICWTFVFERKPIRKCLSIRRGVQIRGQLCDQRQLGVDQSQLVLVRAGRQPGRVRQQMRGQF